MADILSQDEVDLLLSAVSDGQVSGAEEEEQDQGPSLTTYDFRRPERVSKEQLKGLQSLFEALSRDHIRGIVDVQVKQLAKRLAEKRLTVELTSAARGLLAEHGYDPNYGARPLKRAIQRMVLDPLAMELLEGRVKEGDTVTIDADGGELTFAACVSKAA